MGLFNFIKSQFIEVIEWTDSSSQTIVYRFPVENNQIKMGAQLTVRESQMAIFVNEGKIADTFGPGRYTLTTENMPILTVLKSWKYGFNSPFKAEVYFVNTKQFTDQKWGTANPVMLRDPDFGLIRLRAFGTFTFKVADAELFMKEIFGTNQIFDTAFIAGQLKSFIISGLSDMLGEAKIAAPDLASNYDELSEMTENKLQNRFTRMGLELSTLIIENISLPEDVEKAIDERARMNVLENLDDYVKLQTAEAIKEAAGNEGGGLAAAGAGMGAGMAMAQAMAQSMQQSGKTDKDESKNEQSQANSEVSAAVQVHHSTDSATEPAAEPAAEPAELTQCGNCGHEVHVGMKFCPECGNSVQDKACTECGNMLRPGMKFCPDCGAKA